MAQDGCNDGTTSPFAHPDNRKATAGGRTGVSRSCEECRSALVERQKQRESFDPFDEEVSECEALLQKLGEKIEREKIVTEKQQAEKRLNAAGHVGRWAKRRIIEKRAHEVAMSEKAVKIQGAWRRKMAKDRVQHMRATCTLQAWARGWSIRRQTDAMKKEKIAAVIEIQRRSRAYLAKKAASKRLSFEDRINRRHAYRMAAISIQRAQRSRIFRRACENMSILVEAELLRRAGLDPKISGRMKKKEAGTHEKEARRAPPSHAHSAEHNSRA